MAEENERVGRVRKGNRTGGYTVIQNSLIYDLDLSSDARFLMVYLLSRPEDWELRIADVRRFLGVNGKPCGRNKAYGIVAELKQRHYVVMCDDVGEDGHFAGVTYYLFEHPEPSPERVQQAHRERGNGLDIRGETPRAQNREADVSPRPFLPHTEKGDATNKRYIQNPESPQPPKLRKTRRSRARERGRGVGVADQPAVVAKPLSVQWVEHRIRLLQRGREKLPVKAPPGVQRIIDKGGDAGERERLAHQARNCWPTVRAMDEAAQDARGWRVSADLFEIDLASRYRSVRIDSQAFAEWQEEHRQRGWPLFPTPSRATSVWLPAEGAAALNIPNDARLEGTGHDEARG